ncbi:hypothetical protein AWE51_19120 [Aquimarina aggregata]|uniref:Uncharacterized protein n=1 Tax=Aquimarina aggregata TaxID=1642818 RepID=A0A162WKE7_9FLAO|nr:hypothetical protein [Aquimarina aggregata]KZS38157.1 hypothetical protein AWE51_19120 [Aquimarina aggregata]
MKVTKRPKRKPAQEIVQAKRDPFFKKEGKRGFFSNSNQKESSFFTSYTDTIVQRKPAIQKDDDPARDAARERERETNSASNQRRRQRGTSPADRCYINPQFPDFRCLAYALKLNIDENLYNNAHHFYRIASLYPNNNELMWNTFLRYGLGTNLLQTSFGFLGANETLGTVLSYGTGIGLKSYEFFQSGQLQLDMPIPLGRGVNLDLQFDLNANPDNLMDIRGVSGGVGFSGHF